MSMHERFTAAHGSLLVVDIQEKLVARMADRDRIISSTRLLIQGARELGLSVAATEQYPKGLGPTVPDLLDLLPERHPKTSFHCCAVPQFLEQLYGRQVKHVTVVGVEAHVCVAQTVLELLRLGFRVQVPADAVTSRHRIDREYALRRLENAGAVVSTTEAVLFEWAERADRPEFKIVSELIKASEPRRESETWN